MERQKIMEDTELIKMQDSSFRFIHTEKKKVSAKMFDYNCDVKLKVGDDVFEAHKDVLSEASDYFTAMFSHDMVEKGQDAIKIKGISSKGFTQMLEYFYHGRVTIETDHIEACIEAARFFHIEWLIYVCCYFLIYNTSVENFDSVLLLADKYALDTLKADVFQFIGQNFPQLAEQDKIAILSHDILEMLLTEDLYIAAPEKVILDSVLSWVSQDQENREQYAQELLCNINYALMHPDDVDSLPEDLNKYPQVMKLIEEAKEYLANPYAQCLYHSKRTSVRGSKPMIAMVSAVDDSDLILYKLPGSVGLHSEPLVSNDLESVYEYIVSTVLGNFLYIVGGYNRKYTSTNLVYRLDLRFSLWVECGPMNECRTSFSLCNDGVGLYAAVGVNHMQDDSEVLLKTVERYNPVDDEWSLIAGFSKGMFETASAAYGGAVYLSGGISEDDLDPMPLNFLQRYDPDQNEWTMLSPMVCGRQGHSLTAHNGKLYAIGGFTSGRAPDDEFSPPTFTDSFRNEIYDIETDQWTEISPSPEKWGHLFGSTSILNGQIYMVGGKHINRHLHTYDTETLKWVDSKEEEGEYVGPYIRSVLAVEVSLPFTVS